TRSTRIAPGGLTIVRGDQVFAAFDPVSPTDSRIDHGYLARRLAATGARPRAERVAQALPEPQRLEALAWIDSYLKPQSAAVGCEGAVGADATSQSARFGLARMLWRRSGSADPEWTLVAAPLSGGAGAVAQGWPLAARADWAALEALEPALAGVGPRDPSQ